MAEITRLEDLLDREGRRKQIEGREPLAGVRDLQRVLVAVPQLGGQVVAVFVRDH